MSCRIPLLRPGSLQPRGQSCDEKQTQQDSARFDRRSLIFCLTLGAFPAFLPLVMPIALIVRSFVKCRLDSYTWSGYCCSQNIGLDYLDENLTPWNYYIFYLILSSCFCYVLLICTTRRIFPGDIRVLKLRKYRTVRKSVPGGKISILGYNGIRHFKLRCILF